MSQMKSALIARKGILSGSTAIQKMNASTLELSRLWFRKCVCVCVEGGLEVWGHFVLSLS